MPRARAPKWMAPTRSSLVAAALVAAVVVAALVWALFPRPAGYTATARFLTVTTGPQRNTPVRLDTTFFVPAGASAARPVPAVLLAHGFGQTKKSVAGDAEQLAGQGFAVLTWTAQGFGRSGGEIHLDSPDWEVRDASQLVSWLGRQPQVQKQGPDDPRVGAVGGSYGGALALLLAADDQRVDAIVPEITWNDLAAALLPNAVSGNPGTGVLKKAWVGLLFGEGGQSPASPSCGRFAADLCRLYQQATVTGTLTPEQRALLQESSPSSVLGRIHAPTLLIQGETDTLFTLAQANASARGIARNGTPVRVAWYTGGHSGGDGPQSDQDLEHGLVLQWLTYYLKHQGPPPGRSFVFSRLSGFAADGAPTAVEATVTRYPGLDGQRTRSLPLKGPPQPLASPPNGTPSAVSSVPGAETSAAALSGEGATDLPGQHATFASAPLDQAMLVAGTPRIHLRVASPSGSAVLFLKLYDASSGAPPTLPGGIVAPVRLEGLTPTLQGARPITVPLAPIVHQFAAGHRLVVVAATSDEAYLGPARPATYAVALSGGLTVPIVNGQPLATESPVWPLVLLAVVLLLTALLVVSILTTRRRRRRGARRVERRHAGTPLVVEHLRKVYANGFVAADDISFRVEPGQVVGLLGPNGAGKTTTLRALMGLTTLSAGSVFLFGHPLQPGAPVLSRIGSLVEGPGFLPHLSGAENLRLYWQSTGRPRPDAHVEEALEIAGLGGAVDRRVGTYSHGMRQRLAIAQAMLGLPQLLVLDEPTDGLDPPQIAEMREVLRGYAGEGRAVLVSSHLLAEVEQTCTHAVIVHRGRVAATGAVADLVGESSTVMLDVSDPDEAERVLREAGAREVRRGAPGTLICDLDGVDRSRAVTALVGAGIAVDRVAPSRHLEDAFLDLVGRDTTE
ncbi:MAG: alpha/beta fold hydrolase, partial [Candidatus Dormibacteraceae bacterium]